MRGNRRSIWLILLAIICAFLGFWIVKNASDRAEDSAREAYAQKPAPVTKTRPSRVAEPEPPAPKKVEERSEFNDGTTVQAYGSCRQNELILRFPSYETFTSFLNATANSKVRMVARLDRLLATRLSYQNEQDMRDLLAAENVSFFPSVAAPPDRGAPTLTSESGIEPVGGNLLKMLGITGERSRWGEGVKIGIMDSGVVAHPAIKHFNRSIAVVEFPSDLAKTNGHGTAIASLAVGNSPDAEGVAPAAQIVSIKVATEEGRSDALFMATGILAAVEEHVDLLNISMGQSSDNPLLADAVKIAQEAGIVIVASSGNDGVSDAGYPADYKGVVSVGAVDAKGIHMGFSNFGKNLSLVAPGCGVNAAWPVGRYVAISGTSASTPIVTGAIAAVMSNGNGRRISASEARDAILACTDDVGIPGLDTEYGAGLLNVGRAMRRNTPGILDAAVTDMRVVKPREGDLWQVQVSVQNRGTATIVSPAVEIRTPSGIQRSSLASIAVGDHQVFSFPVYPSTWQGQTYELSASVQYVNSSSDFDPSNNYRQGSFTRP